MFFSIFSNYAPTIYAQRIAESKGCAQCLWLFNDEVIKFQIVLLVLHEIVFNSPKYCLSGISKIQPNNLY